jgi:hypothetical protein
METLMSDKISYVLNKNEEGNFVVTSTVNSFNLDHVTEKDVFSFYKTFSQTASFDTGLLPVNGTGILSIRTAGFDTQVAIQHSPGTYHVNWGDYEGHAQAKTYYVAQPYRIVIGDFREGNLLGARMFYSPVPITSPDNILYHVNLPNINCKGYKGNAVGWVCLYHKEDWSSLPFNEKVNKLIERCSGIETYNDANMSDTDGPRFYSSHGRPEYFSDPSLWQEKTLQDGYGWTMDQDLLIPVLVSGIDDQSQHVDGGQNLTFAMAILGNYAAYYNDTYIPKMYNVISRPDLMPTTDSIAKFINRSFTLATKSYVHNNSDNPYDFTVSHRNNVGSEVFQPSLFQNEDGSYWTCSSCGESYDDSSSSNTAFDTEGSLCDFCIEEYYVYISSVSEYFNYDNDNLRLVQNGENYYHTSYDTIVKCEECSELYGYSGKDSFKFNEQLGSYIHKSLHGEYYCNDCFTSYVSENDLETTDCFSCQKTAVTSPGWTSIYKSFNALIPKDDLSEMVPGSIALCDNCSDTHTICACGLVQSSSTETFSHCQPYQVYNKDSSLKFTVNKCCSTCLYLNIDENDEVHPTFVPFSEELFNKFSNSNVYHSSPFVNVNYDDSF